MAAKKTTKKKASTTAKPSVKARPRKRVTDDLATHPENVKLQRMIERARASSVASISRAEGHQLKKIRDALFQSPDDAANQKRIAIRITKRDKAIEERQRQADPAFWIETDERWHKLLVKFESAHIAEHQRAKREPKKLVRREWVFFNAEAGVFDFTRIKPTPGTPTLQVVRINRGGSWEIDSFLMACVRHHPTLQGSAELTHASARDRMMACLQQAASAANRPERGADVVANSALLVLDLLNPATLEDKAENETLERSMRSDRFWEIAAAIFDFGMHSAYWTMHRDGELEKAATKGHQMLSKQPDQWSELIDSILREYHRQKRELPTAKQIAKLLHVNRKTEGNSDGSPMRFDDPRCKGFPPLSWIQFEERVKKRKRIIKKAGF